MITWETSQTTDPAFLKSWLTKTICLRCINCTKCVLLWRVWLFWSSLQIEKFGFLPSNIFKPYHYYSSHIMLYFRSTREHGLDCLLYIRIYLHYLHMLNAKPFVRSQNWLIFTNYISRRRNIRSGACWVWVCRRCFWWSFYTAVFFIPRVFCVMGVNKRRQVVIIIQYCLHIVFVFGSWFGKRGPKKLNYVATG